MAISERGLESVRFVGGTDRGEPTLLDGLKLLLEDRKCNLGWRVVAKHLLDPTDFDALLRVTDEGDGRQVWDLIGAGPKSGVAKILKTLRAVRGTGGAPDESSLGEVLKKVGVDAYAMARDCLRHEIMPGLRNVRRVDPGIRKTLVTTTTVQGSKGLEADYVFVTHFDDRYFIRDRDKTKVSDQDICNVLVALTRARRKVFLVSSDTTKTPVFLKWIGSERAMVLRPAPQRRPND